MIKGKPLYTVNQIQEKVQEIASRISADYKGKDLVVVAILKGAFMFTSDLVRHISVPLVIDFVYATSYVETETSGEIKLHCDLLTDIKDKDVLLIEDIVDTGTTLKFFKDRFMKQSPRSLKICGLFNKPSRRTADIAVDYSGFDVPNVFIVGYGLDYENKFRNLPYAAIFKNTTEEEQ